MQCCCTSFLRIGSNPVCGPNNLKAVATALVWMLLNRMEMLILATILSYYEGKKSGDYILFAYAVIITVAAFFSGAKLLLI